MCTCNLRVGSEEQQNTKSVIPRVPVMKNVYRNKVEEHRIFVCIVLRTVFVF